MQICLPAARAELSPGRHARELALHLAQNPFLQGLKPTLGTETLCSLSMLSRQEDNFFLECQVYDYDLLMSYSILRCSMTSVRLHNARHISYHVLACHFHRVQRAILYHADTWTIEEQGMSYET